MSFGLLGALFGVFAGCIMVLANRRYLLLVGLLLQYAAVYFLVLPSLGWTISLAKLVAGAISLVILAFSLSGQLRGGSMGRGDLIDSPLFRGGVLLLTLTAGWGFGRTGWLQISSLSATVEIGATILLILGLLMAAFFDEPFRAGLGIMTCLSGFEVVYAGVEPSLAILALLAGLQICLSLVIGYLSQLDVPNRGHPL